MVSVSVETVEAKDKALPVHTVLAPTTIPASSMTVPIKFTFAPRVVVAMGVQNTSQALAPLVKATLVLSAISSEPFTLKI